MTSRWPNTNPEAAQDFAQIGPIDLPTLRGFDAVCLPLVEDGGPKKTCLCAKEAAQARLGFPTL